MDHNRFDDLSRTLTTVPSRRGILGGLASALFTTLPLALGGEEAAARKKRKKGKGKRRKDDKLRRPVVPPPPPPPGCQPDCAGRTCGDDGCGGTCGSCTGGEVCDSGTCVCVPQCAPSNACGGDGCGGSCGACAPDPTCQGTQLSNNVCISGVCTRVTTNCGSGRVCFEDACCTPDTPPSCRRQPVPDGCGGTHPANCSGFCCEEPDGDIACRTLPCP